MSDTPRTDALAQEWDGNVKNLWLELRELERENAALRQELEDVNRVRNSIEGALADAYDEAEADWMSKSRLADAAEEVLKAYINVVAMGTNHPCPENLAICRQLRAAIDAARAKEGQP
jgi:hypothetical protein